MRFLNVLIGQKRTNTLQFFLSLFVMFLCIKESSSNVKNESN